MLKFKKLCLTEAVTEVLKGMEVWEKSEGAHLSHTCRLYLVCLGQTAKAKEKKAKSEAG